MRVEFTSRRHVVAAARVAFEAHVDNRPVWCSVSMDAPSERFGVTDTSAHALLGAFETHRAKIEQAARHALNSNGGLSVELEALDFEGMR
ncbi:DUF1488 family protein [Paraburkholderia acidipaludis]|uniref:DUF1488 domain-containing protein n=1 Tax=Paraburkholderia acidipaludis TaxID=660537 RepID=UPI00048575CF|nr:DUF1488 domain-containing protein [Paraburkholderia acidipaludis]